MNTFLPYRSFSRSAACLDRQRLGKQRLEVMQIYNALTVPGAGWAHHPATKMWAGCEKALASYGYFICLEWIERGYNDNMLQEFQSIVRRRTEPFVEPTWLGMEKFHASHRSNLLRKDFAFYSKQGWTEGVGLLYVWPKPGDR